MKKHFQETKKKLGGVYRTEGKLLQDETLQGLGTTMWSH